MIGILDWGIGGVGVLRALRAEAPSVDVVYLSDAGATPYGKLDANALSARVAAAIDHLCALGATEVVVACNAASTVLHTIAPRVRTTGMIEHGARSMHEERGVIGVVGGARTIRSGLYRRALTREGVTVRQRIAQPLSAHIEAGRGASLECEADLARIVAPLRGAQAVLLACTHYPAIAERFEAHLPGTRIIDPAEHVARAVQTRSGHGRLRALTTGNAQHARDAARVAFGVSIDAFEPTTF